MKNYLLMFFSSIGIALIVAILSHKFGLSKETSILHGLLTLIVTSAIGMTVWARYELRDEELEKLHERASKGNPPFFLIPVSTILMTLLFSAILHAYGMTPHMGGVLLIMLFALMIAFSVYIHYVFKDDKVSSMENTSLKDYCKYSAKSLRSASKV